MHGPDDERLPDELREVAAAIRESRTQPPPLRLDELKLRARRQAESRRPAGFLGRTTAAWRRKAVATLVAVGLMLSTSAGVVVAAQSLGTSKKPKLSANAIKQAVTKPKKDASRTQYCPPSRHDDSDSDTARDRDSDSDCDRSDSD